MQTDRGSRMQLRPQHRPASDQSPPLLDAHLHPAPSFSAAAHGSANLRLFLNSASPSDWPLISEAASESAAGAAAAEIVPFFGIHPWAVSSQPVTDAAVQTAGDNLAEHLLRHRLACIGEAGLDRSPAHIASFDAQLRLLKMQLALAADTARPISLHCVRAWGPLLNLLRRFGTPATSPVASISASGPPPRFRFMLHAFYGPAELAAEAVRLGGWISLSEKSFRNPAKSASVIRAVPADRLLIETDFSASSSADPAHLQILENNYNVVSEIRNTSPERLRTAVWNNGKIFTDGEASRQRET